MFLFSLVKYLFKYIFTRSSSEKENICIRDDICMLQKNMAYAEKRMPFLSEAHDILKLMFSIFSQIISATFIIFPYTGIVCDIYSLSFSKHTPFENTLQIICVYV